MMAADSSVDTPSFGSVQLCLTINTLRSIFGNTPTFVKRRADEFARILEAI